MVSLIKNDLYVGMRFSDKYLFIFFKESDGILVSQIRHVFNHEGKSYFIFFEVDFDGASEEFLQGCIYKDVYMDGDNCDVFACCFEEWRHIEVINGQINNYYGYSLSSTKFLKGVDGQARKLDNGNFLIEFKNGSQIELLKEELL